MWLHLKGGINFGGILQRKETVTNLSQTSITRIEKLIVLLVK